MAVVTDVITATDENGNRVSVTITLTLPPAPAPVNPPVIS